MIALALLIIVRVNKDMYTEIVQRYEVQNNQEARIYKHVREAWQ